MLKPSKHELQAAIVASSVYLLAGLNIAFSANIVGLISSKTITMVEESFIGSINLYAGAFSSIGVGYLTNTIGRKTVILISMLFNLAAWTTMTFFLYNIEIVYFCRILSGLAAGMKAASVLYISEICNKNQRGKLLVLNGLFFSIGISLTYVIQYFFSPQLVAIVALVIALFGAIQAYSLHETKYYLLMKNDLQQAQISMLWFDQTITLDDIHQEIEEILAQQQKVKPGASIAKIFQNSSAVKSFLTCWLICSMRILASRTAIDAHPRNFFGLFLLPVGTDTMTLIQGLNEVIFSLIGIPLVDAFPRKRLLHWCCWTMNTCLLICCFQATLVERVAIVGQVIVFVCLTGYMSIASGLLLNLTAICEMEIASTSTELRAIIYSSVQFCGCILLAIYTNAFPLLLASLPLTCMLLFMFASLATLSLVISYVPETAGKALHQCNWQKPHKGHYLLTEDGESDIPSSEEDSSV